MPKTYDLSQIGNEYRRISATGDKIALEEFCADVGEQLEFLREVTTGNPEYDEAMERIYFKAMDRRRIKLVP